MLALQEHKARMEEERQREREAERQRMEAERQRLEAERTRFDALAQYVASLGVTMGRPAPPELFAPPPPYPYPPYSYVSSTSLTKALYYACQPSCR